MALCGCIGCGNTSNRAEIQRFLCANVDAGTPTTASPPATQSPATAGDGFTPNTFSTTEIGTTGNFTNPDINGLLSGTAWDQLTVTYSFPTDNVGYVYFFDTAPYNGFQALVPAQQAVARQAFSLVSQYTPLNFVEQTGANAATAQIRLAGSATPATSYAYFPGPNQPDGDIWFGNTRNDVPTKGGYAYSTYLHEIGHALGLKHGHVNDGVRGVLPAAHNSTEWSLMTYMSYIGASGASYENPPAAATRPT